MSLQDGGERGHSTSMRLAAKLVLGGVGLVASGALVWRYVAGRRRAPCPTWLAWMLETRYTEAVAGVRMLLDRADVRPGMRVLDAGCGPGRLSFPAAERVGPTGEVVALDVQPGMLELLERRMREQGVTNVKPRLGSLGDGSLPRDAFDRVLLVTVLGEVPDRPAALRDIAAALKPGGVLSVSEVLPDPHYQRRATVERLAADAGLRKAASFGSALAFTLNFVKPPSPGS